MEWLDDLTYSKISLTLRATTNMLLPPFKGSTFRGAFGNEFKDLVCLNREADCDACVLRETCAYHYIFETPNFLKLDWFSSPFLPHPFVLEPPQTERLAFKEGELLTFELVLVGRGIDYLPYFIFVFDSIGKNRGLGMRRRGGYGRYEIVRVQDVLGNGKTIYDHIHKTLLGHPVIASGGEMGEMNSHESIDLTFLTPTRIKSNGRYVWLHERGHFPAEVFLKNLYRRFYLLTAGHCGTRQSYREPGSMAGIEGIPISLGWRDWQRYSSRQNQHQVYGGFVGELRLKGALAPWLKLIKLGEIFHVGSGTSFGLGKYVVSVPEK